MPGLACPCIQRGDFGFWSAGAKFQPSRLLQLFGGKAGSAAAALQREVFRKRKSASAAAAIPLGFPAHTEAPTPRTPRADCRGTKRSPSFLQTGRQRRCRRVADEAAGFAYCARRWPRNERALRRSTAAHLVARRGRTFRSTRLRSPERSSPGVPTFSGALAARAKCRCVPDG